MKRPFALLLTTLFIHACLDRSIPINSNDINSIIVSFDSSQHTIDVHERRITNYDSIQQIIKELKDCEKEPIYFLSTDRLKITYSNGTEKEISFSGTSMNYEGLTYRLRKPIREIIGN